MNLNEFLSSQNFEALRNKYMMESWKRNIEAVKNANEGQFSDAEALSLATLLENTKREMDYRLNEITEPTAIGPFKRYAFDILTAVMPNIISNELVSVQPLKQKLGQIFMLEFDYGSGKGATQSGSTMFNWYQVGQVPADPNYTSEFVNNEQVSNATSNPSGNLAYTPIRPGTVTFTYTTASGTQTVTDDGAGGLWLSGATPTQVGSNFNYSTGAFSFTASGITGATTANYQYNLETATSYGGSNIPEVNIKVSEFMIQARARKLRANYAFDAAYDLQISQGINIDDALLQAAASEIRHEIDVEITNDILNQAGLSTEWSLTPQNGVPWEMWKPTFVDQIVSASNQIFQNTRRAMGNFMIVGKKGADVLMALGERFRRSGIQNPQGPFFLGVLDGQWKVYYNPYYPVNKYVVGYKGDNFLEAGYVYAPYLPVFATQLIMLDDFVGRRGFATSYGKKMLNNIFYVQGTLTGKAVFPQ